MPEVDVKVSFICLRDIMVNLKIYIKVLDFEKDILLHSVDKHVRQQKGQCKMDNTEKLATYETNKSKHNTLCVGHHYLCANKYQ